MPDFLDYRALPRLLPTDAFNKFQERPNLLLKPAGSALSRRSNI